MPPGCESATLGWSQGRPFGERGLADENLNMTVCSAYRACVQLGEYRNGDSGKDPR